MNNRPFWTEKIALAWKKRPIVWVSGVRRVGKTTLSKMFSGAVYLNCDLPSTAARIEDIESFLGAFEKGTTVVFDEIHRLEDPSRLLKIAADEYSHLCVLATGSSTLAATRKFRDSLTGRKTTIYMPPVLWSECPPVFKIRDIDRRMLHGGLPEALLSSGTDPSFYSEWIDSYYARDIHELFGIRNRTGFLRLFRQLLLQSGGLLDYSSLSMQSGLSYPTVNTHVEGLCIAHALFLLPPYHGGGSREIVRRPKAYAFDTGFVAFVNGWEAVREGDRGLLWEHMVLDELRSVAPQDSLHYWRDKSGREIDFVVAGKGGAVCAIECRMNPGRFDAESLQTFRSLYPSGENLLVVPFAPSLYKRKYGGHTVTVCTTARLHEIFAA